MKWLICFVLAISVAQAAESSLTFEQAIDQIINRSTDVSTQTSQVGETNAAGITARTAFFPNISLQLARTVNQDNALLQRTASSSLSAIGKWNLFRFGADVKGWQAAAESEDSETLALADAILKSEGAAVQLLVAEVQAEREARVLSEIVRKENELLKIGRERYARGLLPLQEVDKIAVDTENAGAKLADTEIRASTAKANLKAQLGQDSIEAEWPWAEKFRQLQVDPKRRATVLGKEDEIPERPDVRAALKNLESQEDRASAKVRQALPSLDSQFTYATYGLVTNPQTGTYLNPNWTASLVISIPLFDQLAGYSSARVQYFEKEKASAELEKVQRNAQADLRSSREAFETALSTAIAREKTVQLSRKLYNDSLARFRLGRMNANELSLDESRLTDSELLATAGWAQAHLALTRLCHSRGLRVRDCMGTR